MGEVYRAHHRTLGRDVALKVLPAAVIHDPDRVARFEREARAVAALSHPNILAIHDFGCANGVHFAVTELLDGQTLRDLLHSGPVPVPKAIAITTQIARGLEAAHTRGIVHRDLKPENVFVLNDGQIKILDFGLAKAAPTDRNGATTAEVPPGGTAAGAVLGTAGYMSPEQVRGEAVDHRTDLFSLGCILYELIAGRRAFQGDSAIDTLHATLHADPPDVATLVAVPESLGRIVARCLEKQPTARFQSAADLRFALDTMSDTARGLVRATVVERRPIPVRRVAVAAFAIITIAGMAGVWYWLGRGAVSPAATAVAQRRGVAVLPFENLGDVDQAYFAAGVTEEVTLQLAKVSTLRVMSRVAVSRFKDPAAQLPDMARDLGIGAVLTGSVRHSGSQVRVGVQLLAAPGGESMWSEQYDRTVSNLFDVQSEIAVRVTRALQASLLPEERERIQRAPTTHPEAYELYLQQRRLPLGAPEQNQQGIDTLQKAIALDPQFALGYAVLAQRLAFKGSVYGRAEFLRGIAAGRQAVRIDPQLARGRYALANVLSASGQIEEARLSMQRAIELDGNYYSAMEDLSLLELNAGRLDQSAYWAMRAWPLAPNVPNSYYHVAIALNFLDAHIAQRWLTAAASRFKPDDPAGGHRIPLMQAVLALRRGDNAAAIASCREAIRARPGNAEGPLFLTEFATYADSPDAEAMVDAALKERPDGRGLWAGYTPRTLRAFLYTRAGRPERARPLLETVLEVNRKAIADGDRSMPPVYEDVAVHAMLGNREAALAAWERVVEMGWPEAKIDVYDSLIAAVKDDPRFIAALDRVKRRIAEMFARVDVRTIDEWIARGAPTTAVR
jgi:TolB-like protein/tetratricopeptide (TPR) repeat protein